jgi:hypothetical protein
MPSSLPYEKEITHPQVVDAAAPPMTVRPPLWDAPVAFLLASLEEAGVRVVERRFEVGQTIYVRGNPARHLYVVTEGVVKLYKGYGEHKEAIVTLLEKVTPSVSPSCGWRTFTATPPKRPPFAG